MGFPVNRGGFGYATSYRLDPAGNVLAVYPPAAGATDATNPNAIPTSYTYYDENLLRTGGAVPAA